MAKNKIDDMVSCLNDIATTLSEMKKDIEIAEADGCTDCAFEDAHEWELPCRECKRGCKDYWRRKAD